MRWRGLMLGKDMQQLLQQYFGFSEFRTGQEKVIQALINGHNAAAIFPTGSGKSLCYQFSAIVLPHLTLVVSPLLALIQDQLNFLHSKHISAASIQSMQTREEATDVYRQLKNAEIKILFVSVERLNNERFRLFLKGIKISLLVIDEAHCISEWGHNFRPDYLKLVQYQKDFHIPQTLLLTATATDAVIDDMSQKFNIHAENISSTGSYRANLNLSVLGAAEQDKLSILLAWLQTRLDLSGIIYVTLQKTAEEVALQLQQQGLSAMAYHAGLNSDIRQLIQRKFMSGKLPLIVATIAFGMGIDKSAIRYVIHYDLPKSIENYAQEIGRAGRDGKAADCLVLANTNNINVIENFVYSDTPEACAIEFVLNEITQTKGQWEVLLNSLSRESNIRLLALKTLLVYLELEGVLTPTYSYYGEYKFKLLVSQAELLSRFKEERYHFVDAILQSAQKAKIWSTMDFDKLDADYPSDRHRVVTALDYLDQQGLIELQTQQMTNVYNVFQDKLDSGIKSRLVKRFVDKENSEIKRIGHLLSYFTKNQCLSLQLAQYFSDSQLLQPCGHCCICLGHDVVMPKQEDLPSLKQFNAQELMADISSKLPENVSSVLLARFFCGLTTPIFARLRVYKITGFALFKKYRFSDVKNWIEGK